MRSKQAVSWMRSGSNFDTDWRNALSTHATAVHAGTPCVDCGACCEIAARLMDGYRVHGEIAPASLKNFARIGDINANG